MPPQKIRSIYNIVMWIAHSITMASDSKNISASKLRRRHPGTSRPSNLDIIDDAWASDKLSDDEVETSHGEHAISLLLEDEGELDDGIVTSANSGSAASGALERRRREEGRWNDLGLDLFDGTGAGGVGAGGGNGIGGATGGSGADAAAAAGASAGGGQAGGGN
jgi:hypothetical protein